MLSILIPTYNYDISSLVNEVHKQASNANINFEIICFNDGSEKYNYENKSTIDSLSHTKIINSKENFGRVKSRQLLSNESIYDWLLFLDADVMPKSDKFIEYYINETNSHNDVIYGGFAYTKEKTSNNSILRWKYGKTFEEIDAKKRNLKPYQIIISANFLIKKTVFEEVSAKINRKSYGLDNYFAALLKQNNYNVLHINNEVYHFGLETSDIYLKKVEEAIETLLHISNKKITTENSLLNTFLITKRFRINYVIIYLHKLFGNKIKKNLLGHTPSLICLQFYKISYMCFKGKSMKNKKF